MVTFCGWCASKDLVTPTPETQICRKCRALYLNDRCINILSRQGMAYLLKHPERASKYRNMNFRTVVRSRYLYRVSKIDKDNFILERDVRAKGGHMTIKEKVPAKLLSLNGITQVGQKARYVNCMRVNKETGLIESVEYYMPLDETKYQVKSSCCKKCNS